MKSQKTERSLRAAAIEAAQKCILEKAKNYPEKFAKGLLTNPELTAGVRSLDEVFRSLLEAGQRENLIILLSSDRLPRDVKKTLAGVLLLG